MAQQRGATDAAKERDQAVADAAAADGAAVSLRKRVAALVADVRRAAASTGSTATGDALGLLADVLGRTDEAAGEFARIADERGIAGRQCERSYDALIVEADNRAGIVLTGRRMRAGDPGQRAGSRYGLLSRRVRDSSSRTGHPLC
ncbi:DUF2514 family protein [Burkholderia diffusa]|uniref:DUF2514 family protein n=1 Tax=Burkholderia diffusa TaxID=488732 RepID=UPI003F51A25F